MDTNVINLDIKPMPLTRARLLPLLPPRSQAEAEHVAGRHADLQRAAAADDHLVLAPTHVMMKGEQIVGYLSLGGLPTVHAWFDSKSPHASDSLKMIETGEAIMASNGARQYAVAVAEHSPFTAHMERLGFTKLGTTTLWTKAL